MISNFCESTKFIVATLGEKPFHLRGRLNYGALDSVMAAVLADIAPSDIAERFKLLIADDDYNEAITYNTSDEAVVEMRLDKAVEFFS